MSFQGQIFLMYENRIVDNLPSTEDSHYCELGQRRIKHNYIQHSHMPESFYLT